MPASCLTAFSTRLDAACMSGEFLPVTIVPSGSSMAAPQKTPLLPLPRLRASSRPPARRLDDPAVLRLDAELLHISSTRSTVSRVDHAHGVLAAVAEIAPDDFLPRRLAHGPSSTMPKPARFTPMSVGDR